MAEKTTFQEDITDYLADNEAVMERLGADWSVVQDIGRISVPTILDNYDREVEETLGYGFRLSNRMGIVGDHWRKILDMPAEHPIAEYYHAPRRARSGPVRTKAEREDAHLAEIVRFLHLQNDIHITSGTDRAQRSVDAIYAVDTDEETKMALHRSIDYWIYKEARHAPQFAKILTIPDLASSEDARNAMRGGLDRRVMKYALRDKSPDRKIAQELIAQFASTDTARDAMLGHIAILLGGGRSHSIRYYQPRITDAFVEQLLIARIAKLGQRLRDQQERHRQQHKEWYRKFEEDYKQNFSKESYDFIFGEGTTKNSRRAPDNNPEKHLTTAINNAHHSVRGTLLRMDRTLLLEAVKKVHALRESEPGITDRKIVAHFHHLGQLKDAAMEDVEAAKAILLFATVTKGKQTALCF